MTRTPPANANYDPGDHTLNWIDEETGDQHYVDAGDYYTPPRDVTDLAREDIRKTDKRYQVVYMRSGESRVYSGREFRTRFFALLDAALIADLDWPTAIIDWKKDTAHRVMT